MRNKAIITILVFLISVAAIITTVSGIFSNQGAGSFRYNTVRGETIIIYGKGIYRHMSVEVAPQGIAQDYVTLFLGVPLLLLSLFLSRNGSIKGRFLLSGTFLYFLVTYLFYLCMGMYNEMFLLYVSLTGMSFFGFIIGLLLFDLPNARLLFKPSLPAKAIGITLIVIASSIALLWLSIVVPPLIDGSIIPAETAHYTTLIVQGLDLGLLLPAAIISGILLIRKNLFGYLLVPVYFIFLTILMIALTAKILMMGVLGYSIVPAIFIIPVFTLISLICVISIFRNLMHSNYHSATD